MGWRIAGGRGEVKYEKRKIKVEYILVFSLLLLVSWTR